MPSLPKASKKLKDLLNEAIAREIQVSVQYMWQHVLWSGVQAYAVKDVFKSIAIAEMKHAEAIAERLVYLGGAPTTKPTPIFVGEGLKAMIEQDVKDEAGALVLYRQIIGLADKEGDIVTRKLFEQILVEEEDHHDTFTSLLEGF
jgi:bacterioferritin